MLQLTPEALENTVRRYLEDNSGRPPGSFTTPSAGAATKGILALSDAQRANLVRQASQVAKSIVMTPAFSAAWDKYIENRHNAVNHGLKVENTTDSFEKAMQAGDFSATESAMNKMMREIFVKGVQERLPQVDTWDRQQFEIMAEVDAMMADNSAPSTAAEKANVARAKSMYEEAKKLAATDLAKARTTYKQAMMLAAGIQNESAAAAAVAGERQKEQQLNYDRYALKPLLKRRLQEFIAVARSVNHNAPTQMKDGKRVFTNRNDESRDEFWKLLYRLGPGGTNAAVAVAQAWVAEL
jgi:hypothetical protein